jgi:hypothetical protein
VAVFSTADCYWSNERDERGHQKKVWRYNHDNLSVAKEDVLRRCRLAMLEGLSFIILDDPNMHKTEVTQFLTLARSYKYEIIPIDVPDHRYEVLSQRHTQGKEHYPPDLFGAMIKGFSSSTNSWALEGDDGSTFVNPEAPESDPVIEPAVLEPQVIAEEAPLPPITLVLKDFESSVRSVWIFLSEVGVEKQTEQRRITSEMIAVRDTRGTRGYPEIAVSGVDIATIEKRARDLGVSIEIRK